ncbi:MULTISPECIES: DUF4357 domain-containing protein [unclassified Blautia]|uniref:DUF4357 domain-containing protein n=1 Tax=unclassified Blautia TaxID=2648079 RepID=UPI003F8A8A28
MMELELFLKTRGKEYRANAVFKDGVMVVKKGSLVNTKLADHIRGGKKAKSYLEDRQYVDSNGVVLKDCVFRSPSTAAQFVTGNSTNGNLAWKTKDGIKLKDILREESSKTNNDN